ncbi:Aminodeoxychorismate lyase [Pseudoalteromonas holothuriae]|uniref:Aminodeoxychorismate lyase n=1 Tax=Pseudoalteromonas holothuriae TaxID=2963714 RepID=A0A9W4QQZ4_9GAMM|nr:MULTISPECIES: aminodeoxychorismate lyase [unclassified Pseudoalteromonas]CAH9049569.1 Aminodeoxychorismate lyase [Pseudoalteromonas sp. CIP111854]CAH9067330.1 Aminodeoxychorismate lyase [Pseudoalteromonas sp. CIP111951]
MIIVNGQQKSEISVKDRGLLYGDGIFETIKVKGAMPKLWHMHLDRLVHSCNALKIAVPNLKHLQNDVDQVIKETGPNLVLKIIVTRGIGNRGYIYTGNEQPTVIVMSSPEYVTNERDYLNGVKAIFCETRLSHNTNLAGLKHLNRLEQVIARAEWQDPQIREGVLLDNDELVIEGTMSNLFIEKDGVLYTPKLDKSGVSGVVRRKVIETQEAAKAPVCIKNITKNELLCADSIAISNSLMGVIPLSQIGDKVFSISPLIKEIVSRNLHDCN